MSGRAATAALWLITGKATVPGSFSRVCGFAWVHRAQCHLWDPSVPGDGQTGQDHQSLSRPAGTVCSLHPWLCKVILGPLVPDHKCWFLDPVCVFLLLSSPKRQFWTFIRRWPCWTQWIVFSMSLRDRYVCTLAFPGLNVEQLKNVF